MQRNQVSNLHLNKVLPLMTIDPKITSKVLFYSLQKSFVFFVFLSQKHAFELIMFR